MSVVLSMNYPKIPPNKEERIEIYTRAFETFDKNGKGKIPTRKLATAIRVAGHNPTGEQLKIMRREADPDARGEVKLATFIEVLLNHEVNEEEEMKKAFKIFDVNGDGVISGDELREVLTKLGEAMSDEEVDELIKMADVNGDGFIDYEEFCTWMANDAAAEILS